MSDIKNEKKDDVQQVVEEEKEEVFDEYEPQEPQLRLYEIDYLLNLPSNADVTLENITYDELVPPAKRAELLQEAATIIEKHINPYFYSKLLTATTTPAFDQAKLDAMKTEIAKKLEEFEKTIAEHDEGGSEQDSLDAELDRIKYLCSICYTDYEKLNTFVQQLLKKTSSNNVRIAIYFGLAKYFLSQRQHDKFADQIALLAPLVNKDGDWDARNRFNIYLGISNLINKNSFQQAAQQFISSIQTYSTTDLIPLDNAMATAALLAIICSPRKDFIDKVVNSPEIIQSLLQFPNVQNFVNYLYKCQYSEYHATLPHIYQFLLTSPYLGHLAQSFVLEARAVAYNQFLAAFQYVKIQAFADKFGVGVDYIEQDVSKLITEKKLFCKINSVDNIIEVAKVNNKMQQFTTLIEQADNIVSRVNRLTQQGKTL